MKPANFYGQTPWGLYRTPSFPTESLYDLRSLESDKWTPRESPFEQKLAKEIHDIKLMSENLSTKMAQAQVLGLNPELKNEINETYEAIVKAKKIMAFLVENMRKSMEAIAANFR